MNLTILCVAVATILTCSHAAPLKKSGLTATTLSERICLGVQHNPVNSEQEKLLNIVKRRQLEKIQAGHLKLNTLRKSSNWYLSIEGEWDTDIFLPEFEDDMTNVREECFSLAI